MPVVRHLRSVTSGVLDQVLLSVTSLVVGLALARSLPPESFGAYAVTFAVYLMGLSLQVSLVTDPLIILGARRSEPDQRAYFGTLLRLETLLSLALAALIASLAAVGYRLSGGAAIWAAIAGLGIAQAPMQLQAFIRSVLLARLRPGAALLNDAIHCVTRIAGVPLLASLGLLSPFWVFVVHALAAVISILSALPLCRDLLAARPSPYRIVLAEHWTYGKWMLAASGAHWLSGQAPLVLISSLLSPLAAAVLKACQYLVSPIQVVLTGLESVLAPRASRLASQGEATLDRFLLRVSILTTAGTVLYALLLLPVSRSLMDMIYKGRYTEYSPVVGILLVDTVLRAMSRAPVLRLKVGQDTRRIFIAYAWAAGVAMIAMVLLAPAWGVIGAAVALPLASIALLAHMLALPRGTLASPAKQHTTSVASF